MTQIGNGAERASSRNAALRARRHSRQHSNIMTNILAITRSSRSRSGAVPGDSRQHFKFSRRAIRRVIQRERTIGVYSRSTGRARALLTEPAQCAPQRHLSKRVLLSKVSFTMRWKAPARCAHLGAACNAHSCCAHAFSVCSTCKRDTVHRYNPEGHDEG